MRQTAWRNELRLMPNGPCRPENSSARCASARPANNPKTQSAAVRHLQSFDRLGQQSVPPPGSPDANRCVAVECEHGQIDFLHHVRSSALASSAPRRCSRSVSLPAHSPRTSHRRAVIAPRAARAHGKVFSRRAESRLNGLQRMHYPLPRRPGKAHHAPSNTTRERTARLGRKITAHRTPKPRLRLATEKQRQQQNARWWVSFFVQSQIHTFQPSIKGASAQAEPSAASSHCRRSA